MGVVKLREATSCPNWNDELCPRNSNGEGVQQLDFEGCVSAVQSRNSRANRRPILGFIFSEKDGSDKCNCLFDKKLSRKSQHNNGVEIDGTCQATPGFETDATRSQFVGWNNQQPGDFNHYSIEPTCLDFNAQWVTQRYSGSPMGGAGSGAPGSGAMAAGSSV